MLSSDDLKQRAAAAALDAVRPGMLLGLGTGSTAEHFLRLLSIRVKEGLGIKGVPTSERTAEVSRRLGIPLADEAGIDHIDLTIDGADEIGPDLALIKGAGGALLREKIIASASRRMIVIADETKLVPRLGHFPLPIEVIPFGLKATLRLLREALGAFGYEAPKLSLRRTKEDRVFASDGGHIIVDAALERIDDPLALSRLLLDIPGVIEHGLFLGLASEAYVAGANGVEHLSRGDVKIG